MNTRKINTTVIALITATAFLSGCGDEQKEAAQQTAQTTTESTPAAPHVAEVVNKTTEMAPATAEVVKDVTEQTVEKTAEAAQDVKKTAETATAVAVTTVKETASNVMEVVKATPERVRKIQQALLKAGFNPGPADGVMGPKTKAALESFQKQKNLAVGQVTKETLLALGISE